jgi:hypothetical protein
MVAYSHPAPPPRPYPFAFMTRVRTNLPLFLINTYLELKDVQNLLIKFITFKIYSYNLSYFKYNLRVQILLC